MVHESEAKHPVVEAKPPVNEAKPPVNETKHPVNEASSSVHEAKSSFYDEELLFDEVAETDDDQPAAKSSEEFDEVTEPYGDQTAVKSAEEHADAEKKSTPVLKKKGKQYLIALVGVLLLGTVCGVLFDQKEGLKQVEHLKAFFKQAETSVRKSKVVRTVLSGFGQIQPKDASQGALKNDGNPLTSEQKPNDSNEEAANTTYEVSKPLVKDLTLNDEYVCQIRAIQHIEIRSLEKGYLQNVLIDEGDNVRKGQLLFQIKPNVYEADVQKSEAEVELSKIELENNQALVDKDIISPTEAAMSAAKLNKVKAELELAKTHLGFTEIRAPFDGLIGRFGDIRLGSLLEENQLLTTLSDTHRLWVYFNVPEAQYLDYMEHKRQGGGGSLNVKLELANNKIYSESGTIETIQSDFSNTSGNIAFRASFSNPRGLLRYGQTGKILWPNQIKQAVIVPQKSTFEILDKRFILVVDKSGVIHERVIKVAHEQPNIYVVESGISPDEMFLLERQNKLDKGDKIRYKLIDPQRTIDDLKLYAE